MLFMMTIGAPPYKRAITSDTSFNYIINGALKDVLEHWKRLNLISKDCLDCMMKIFRYEKDRMSMDELISHPFVDLENEINAKTDKKRAFNRLQTALTEYHLNYVLPMQVNCDEIDSNNIESRENDDNGGDPEATFQSPNFGAVCKAALGQGSDRLLDDFRVILQNMDIREAVKPEIVTSTNVRSQNWENNTGAKPTVNNGDDEKAVERKRFDVAYGEFVESMIGNPFIHSQNSIILRRCFRDQMKIMECEDHTALIDVYGKDSKSVMQDPRGRERMTMQIMDSLYCYFAYAYDLGFAFQDVELDEIARTTHSHLHAQDDGDDGNQSNIVLNTNKALVKLKGLLKVKKEKMMQTQNGKRIYQQIAVRKKSPPSMSSQEMVMFLKTIQRQQVKQVKEGENHKLKKFQKKHWNVIISAFQSEAVSENAFLKMKRKQFSNLMLEKKKPGSPTDSIIPVGFIVKLDGFLRKELEVLSSQRFKCEKEKLEECTPQQIEALVLNVMQHKMKIDIANDVHKDILKNAIQRGNINGRVLCGLDEEYFITNVIAPSLKTKFGNLDAHPLGTRYRYWPEYARNNAHDLYNGGIIQQWYTKPKYSDIKQEALNNPLAKISVIQWNHMVLFAKDVLLRTSGMRSLKADIPDNRMRSGLSTNSSWQKYGVKYGDTIRLEQLVPLLLFVQLDYVSKAVVQSCNNNNWRDGDKEMMKKVMDQHANVAQISRLVRETVECFGQKWGLETDRVTPTFYHLLDKDIVPSSLDLRFFSPMSVTPNLNAALVMNDFDENEVVLQLKCTPDSNLKYFDCSWFSEYPLEGEHIMCGGLGTATICNIYDLCAGMRYDYHVIAMEMFMAAISKSPIGNLDKEAIEKVASALSAMMDYRFKTSYQPTDYQDDEKKSEDDSFINESFGAMCNAIHYVQIDLVKIKRSEILMAALLDEDGMIRFNVLCRMLPFCRQYFVSVQGLNAEKIQQLLYGENLKKFLVEIGDDDSCILQTVWFNVETEMKWDPQRLDISGWTMKYELEETGNLGDLHLNLNQEQEERMMIHEALLADEMNEDEVEVAEEQKVVQFVKLERKQ